MTTYDLAAMTKIERWKTGAIREHEFYRVCGFIQIIDGAAREDILAILNAKSKRKQNAIMDKLAFDLLLDDD